jgi:hypothetical protein
MNLEYAQNTRKVGAGRKKETMSRQVPAASPLFRAGGGIKKDTILAVRQSEGNLPGAPRISIVKKSIYMISIISVAHQTTLPGSSPSAFAFRFIFSTGVSCPRSVSISRRCFSLTFSRIQLLYTRKSTSVTPAQHPVTLDVISRYLLRNNRETYIAVTFAVTLKTPFCAVSTWKDNLC